MYSLVLVQNGKTLDSWGEIKKVRLLGRLRENERIFKLTRKSDYEIGKVHCFEYFENAYAEIKEI